MKWIMNGVDNKLNVYLQKLDCSLSVCVMSFEQFEVSTFFSKFFRDQSGLLFSLFHLIFQKFDLKVKKIQISWRVLKCASIILYWNDTVTYFKILMNFEHSLVWKVCL